MRGRIHYDFADGGPGEVFNPQGSVGSQLETQSEHGYNGRRIKFAIDI